MFTAWLALATWVFGGASVNAASSPVSYNANGNTVQVVAQPLSDSLEIFYGIPFAEPPLGELRFKAPRPPRHVDSVLNKTTFERGCMQGSGRGYSEDCLYLNIYRPTGYEDAKLPVFVFLYGGSFFGGQAQGTNASSIMQAALDLNSPFIFITTNYRLGPFGFGYGQQYLSHGSANSGLLDVVVALEWVNMHVSAFGGDPQRVTLGGSSAGAVATSLMQFVRGVPHLAGLFLNSGSAEANPLARTSDGYPDVYPQLVNLTGCGDPATAETTAATFECLRSVNASSLNNASQTLRSMEPFAVGFPWNPSVDGTVLTDFPRTLLKTGVFRRLPILAGDCEDEGTIFVSTKTNTTDQVVQQVQYQQATFFTNGTIDELLRLYPDDPAVGSPYNTGNDTFGLDAQFKRIASLYGDLGFQSSRRDTLEQINKHHYPKTWTWNFNGLPSNTPYDGVSHTSDLDYWFAQKAARTPTAAGVAQLQATMVQYFVNFIYHSDPSPAASGNVTHWPRYHENGQHANMLNLTGNNDTSAAVVVQDDFRQAPIAYINSLTSADHMT